VTLFDIIAVLILGVSVLVGFLRGALREVATVVSFVLAVVAAIFALRLTGPIARASVHPAWAATGVALVVVFLAAYIALRVLASNLMRSVHNVRTLGTVDRIVGSGFGLVRGLVVLGVFYLAFNLAPPPMGTPDWIANAKLYPLAHSCADVLRTLAPKGSAIAGRFTPVLANAVEDGSDSSGSGQSDQSGYKGAAEKGLDDVARKMR
jgi:membrane protein required for colicin V production